MFEMIRQAKISEINDILNITRACAEKMIKNDIYQWNSEYPSREVFLNDLNRNELFVLIEDDLLIGVITISTYMDKEYQDIEWLTPNKRNIYIHRLAINPPYQSKGHAQKLMTFAENRARKKLMLSVRLDTFSQNSRNQKFYETRGYEKLSDIYFPRQSDYPFHCYELLL